MEITLEEIQKKFENLPEDLKWAIMAANVDDNIISIGQSQGLNVEQMGQLSLETHMVMFGFTHPDKFEQSIKASMKLSDEKTRALANAVNEKILKEIKENMKEAFENASKKPGAPVLEEESDAQILSSAGIEIVPTNSSGSSAGLPPEKEKWDISPEKPEPATEKEEQPILTQKLSSFIKSDVVETQHSLDNITKTGMQIPHENEKNKIPSSDPYREIPE